MAQGRASQRLSRGGLSNRGPVKYREKAHDWEKPQPWLPTLSRRRQAFLLFVTKAGGSPSPPGPFNDTTISLPFCESGETQKQKFAKRNWNVLWNQRTLMAQGRPAMVAEPDRGRFE